MNAPIYIMNAKYIAPLCVHIEFSDGTQRTIDIGSYIRQHPHPQYNKYLEEKKFQQFKIEDGNIVWGKNWDMVFPISDLYNGAV